MAGREKKSKKRSAASSRQPEPTLFLDRCLGSRKVAECLREAGAVVETHDTHFPQDATDETWLTEAGKRGWLVLTKDRKIRYRRNELAAAREAGARMFVLTAGQLTGDEVGEIFVTALQKIYELVRRQDGPFVARITRSGDVSLYEPE